MKTVLVVIFMAICCAAVPQPCLYPQQWEGRVVTIKSVSQTILNSRMSYDEPTKRFRVVCEMEQGSSHDCYDTLYDFDARKKYKLNLRTTQCNVTSIKGKIEFGGVSPDATIISEGTLGANSIPTGHLTAQIWEKEFDDKARLFYEVSYPDCVPISSTFFSANTGVVQYNYFDIALGITDPTVFTPPSQCIQTS